MTMTKTILRQNCLEKLGNSPKHNRLYKTFLVNRRILKLLSKVKNKKILFYYPLKMEVNILKVLHKLRKDNEIYIPFMVEQSFKMVPFRLPLYRKKFNIYEAGNSHKDIKKIDIAIVPVVGVDGNLQRVGFGKGMYDRFFEKLQKKPYIIFTQQEFCYTEKYICDSYDIACDILLTPKKSVSVRKRKKLG